jgi:hypothetical protein
MRLTRILVVSSMSGTRCRFPAMPKRLQKASWDLSRRRKIQKLTFLSESVTSVIWFDLYAGFSLHSSALRSLRGGTKTINACKTNAVQAAYGCNRIRRGPEARSAQIQSANPAVYSGTSTRVSFPDRTAHATMAAVGEAPTCLAGMAGAAPISVNVALTAETRCRAKSVGLSNGADV